MAGEGGSVERGLASIISDGAEGCHHERRNRRRVRAVSQIVQFRSLPCPNGGKKPCPSRSRGPRRETCTIPLRPATSRGDGQTSSPSRVASPPRAGVARVDRVVPPSLPWDLVEGNLPKSICGRTGSCFGAASRSPCLRTSVSPREPVRFPPDAAEGCAGRDAHRPRHLPRSMRKSSHTEARSHGENETRTKRERIRRLSVSGTLFRNGSLSTANREDDRDRDARRHPNG
jgi:hypothetical protein